MEEIIEVRELLKLDLGITSTARDLYFLNLIIAARDELNDRGALLDLDKAADKMLVSDYAAWLYRHRESGEGMSERISQRLANRHTEEQNE